MVKKVLMVAYHYPPLQGSSGLQRTLKFSHYLRLHDWEPYILTVHPRAYPKVSSDQLSDIPRDISVTRAFAIDTARHLSIKGIYWSILALPDRWISWWISAVFSGIKIIRKVKPDVIWTTYPIATAHLIGLTLAKLTGIPWIADFRDSMTEEHYPAEKKIWKIYRWIEKQTIMNASLAVFTTQGTLSMYKERYPSVSPDKFTIIQNGFDEESFREATILIENNKKPGHPMKLLHSGLLYPSERDPTQFLLAISELKNEGIMSQENIVIILRASGYEGYYLSLIDKLNIRDIVKLENNLPYREALSEMLTADGLLIFQASNCNHQIPAKVYEYIRAKRPILALTDPIGDTAHLLSSVSRSMVAVLNDKADIKSSLIKFINIINDSDASILDNSKINEYSREYQTSILAKCLASVVGKL